MAPVAESRVVPMHLKSVERDLSLGEGGDDEWVEEEGEAQLVEEGQRSEHLHNQTQPYASELSLRGFLIHSARVPSASIERHYNDGTVSASNPEQR
jgi:hypothetical protein